MKENAKVILTSGKEDEYFKTNQIAAIFVIFLYLITLLLVQYLFK